MSAISRHLPSRHVKQSGFTIVELLIVIVIIGILAAITIVAYNGITARASFSKMRSDISSLQSVVEQYYAINGSYPSTGGTWYYERASGTGFIPGVVPAIVPTLPAITDGPTGSGTNNTYIYKSNGTDYKIDRLYQPSVPSGEWANVPASMKDQSYTDRWGVWSTGGAGF